LQWRALPPTFLAEAKAFTTHRKHISQNSG
jgi:hypothetical protein